MKLASDLYGDMRKTMSDKSEQCKSCGNYCLWQLRFLTAIGNMLSRNKKYVQSTTYKSIA